MCAKSYCQCLNLLDPCAISKKGIYPFYWHVCQDQCAPPCRVHYIFEQWIISYVSDNKANMIFIWASTSNSIEYKITFLKSESFFSSRNFVLNKWTSIWEYVSIVGIHLVCVFEELGSFFIFIIPDLPITAVFWSLPVLKCLTLSKYSKFSKALQLI